MIKTETLVSGREDTTVTSDRGIGAVGGSLHAAITWVHPRVAITRLDLSELVIGRGKECATVLPGPNVSRQHCRLSRAESGWILRDLGSKNGTFLNGTRAAEAPLSEQDVVRVGECVGIMANVEPGPDDQAVTAIAPGVLGGAKLRHAYRSLIAVATSALDVVLIGETGSGKEVFARKLHELSGRAGPLVSVNCAALPEQMAEGELFGYRKGAFTSAIRSSPGYLRAAHLGTLFLDEVIELEERIQAKLLRALEAREVTPLGEVTPERVDLRVVAAAQASLAERVETGGFRADLYSRLSGIEIIIPPVRDRREDVLPLFRHFMAERCGGSAPGLDADAAEKLCLYDWPLNVREVLQTAARLAVLHGHEPVLSVSHLPARIADTTNEVDCQRPSLPAGDGFPRSRAARRVHESERRNERDMDRLIDALRRARGNVSAAAKALGISRQRAYRLMDLRPDIDTASFSQETFKGP